MSSLATSLKKYGVRRVRKPVLSLELPGQQDLNQTRHREVAE